MLIETKKKGAIPDGIINQDLYNVQKSRIMWILKEPTQLILIGPIRITCVFLKLRER